MQTKRLNLKQPIFMITIQNKKKEKKLTLNPTKNKTFATCTQIGSLQNNPETKTKTKQNKTKTKTKTKQNKKHKIIKINKIWKETYP